MNYRAVSIIAIIAASVFGTLYIQPLLQAAVTRQEHRIVSSGREGLTTSYSFTMGAMLLSADDTWDAWWVINNTNPTDFVEVYLTRPALLQAWQDAGATHGSLSFLANLTDHTELFVRRSDYNVPDLCVAFIEYGGTSIWLTYYSVVTLWY